MRIVARLRDTAHRMKVTAEYLNFYGDHSGLAVQHAAELAGAAEIVGEYKSRGKGKGKSGTSSAHCVAMDRRAAVKARNRAKHREHCR